MNRGLWFKAWRELRWTTLLFGLGILAIHVVLAAVLPNFLDSGLGVLLENPVFQNVVRALLGPVGDQIGPEALLSIAWVHPVVLALLWAHAVLCATRVPAGEVDRGTIDLLLGLPVSRRQVFLTEVAAWAVGAVLLAAAELAGHLIGRALVPPPSAPAVAKLLVVLVNQLALTAVVAAVALLLSAWCDRRGRALGGAFAFCVGMFFWQVLGQFWTPAADLAWLGPLYYYQPHALLQEDAGLPLGSLAVLAAMALALGGLAWARFRGRDLAVL